jgi:hypothetical protein
MKKSRRKTDKPMLITLCARCVADYYNSPEHFVRKANKNQKAYEPCCKCPSTKGRDYSIVRREKR